MRTADTILPLSAVHRAQNIVVFVPHSHCRPALPPHLAPMVVLMVMTSRQCPGFAALGDGEVRHCRRCSLALTTCSCLVLWAAAIDDCPIPTRPVLMCLQNTCKSKQQHRAALEHIHGHKDAQHPRAIARGSYIFAKGRWRQSFLTYLQDVIHYSILVSVSRRTLAD